MADFIACDVHDHFEIACMHGSHVQLTLRDGQVVQGMAKDLSAHGGVEYILLDTEQDVAKKIDLMEISQLLFIKEARLIDIM